MDGKLAEQLFRSMLDQLGVEQKNHKGKTLYGMNSTNEGLADMIATLGLVQANILKFRMSFSAAMTKDEMGTIKAIYDEEIRMANYIRDELVGLLENEQLKSFQVIKGGKNEADRPTK